MGEDHSLNEDDLERMGYSGLIGFGVMMGFLHVLTGTIGSCSDWF